MVTWGGKDYYLGHDEEEAQRAYVEHLAQWRDWRDGRVGAKVRYGRSPLTVGQLIDKFLEHKELENGIENRRYYRKHLRRFLIRHHDAHARQIRPKHLADFKLDLIDRGYKPKTTNHDLIAVRGMLRWAASLEIIPPIELSGVKNLPVGPTLHRRIPAETVRAAIRDADERVRPWLAVNYLACLRPSEVVSVVHDRGTWLEEGVFVLDRGKMDHKVAIRRHCILSECAMGWLEQCEPRWSKLDSYSAAARRSCPIRPKQLQKCAAQHLRDQGVPRDDVDTLLGHVHSRVSVTYFHEAWPRLREAARRICV